MSTLRSGLDELCGEDLKYLSDPEVESRLHEIARSEGVLAAEKARTVAEVERRGVFSLTGHLSITSWMQDRLRTTWSEAARDVRTARALEHMPVVRDALYAGEVSSSAVGQLVEARETSPGEFSQVEEQMVQGARVLPAADLRRAVNHWRGLVEADAAKADRERYDRRGFSLSKLGWGMFRADGNLDPETGQTLKTALDAITAEWAKSPDDDRTPAQLRCDAVGELARQWLDRSDTPVVGGERPHITVSIDLEVLEARTTRPVELGSGEISGESARRLACDASVSRVITRGRSEPLDVGRRTPVVPASLRRAVVVRDGGCRFPGCDRPQPWCDAHHVVHWADGGPTKLSNLLLLCRRHHRMIHDGFGVEMTEAGPRFTRPDGLALGTTEAAPRTFRPDGFPLENRAPP